MDEKKHKPEDRPDEELIAAYREEGLEEAIEELLDRYKPLVLRLSRARYLVGGDRDDLIQEGMIGLYKAVRDYDAEKGAGASFGTFAALCVDRQILHAIEASQREKNRPLNDSVLLAGEEWEEVLKNTAESPEKIVIAHEMQGERIEQLKLLLSPMEKKVLDLFLTGLDYREIADTLKKTPKSIDNALQRIRKKSLSGWKEQG